MSGVPRVPWSAIDDWFVRHGYPEDVRLRGTKVLEAVDRRVVERANRAQRPESTNRRAGRGAVD